ncbi:MULTISPECIES: DUF222 domain-containing protein [unclassified Gordonia (in: high G+C Gram-positive bacteria)]
MGEGHVNDGAAAAAPAPGSAAEVLARIHKLLDELGSANLTAVPDADVVGVAEDAERASRRLAALTDRVVVEASNRNMPRRLGYRSIITFLSQRLHIADAVRRNRQITATASFHGMTGDVLPPACPGLAAELAAGRVAPGHVTAVLDVLDRIPHTVAHDVRVAAEAQMADYATRFTPAEITTLGTRLLGHLDPDGTLTDDKDRRRQRQLFLNRQTPQLMSKLTGHLDPITRARLDVLLDAWAKPGMNNTEDPKSPVGAIGDADPDVVAAAAERDGRTPAQRNHDALSALLGQMLEDGTLGRTHRGLSTQVIIKVDEKDLRRQAGVATTASGALLPIGDVIALAAQSQQYLAVFAEHTSTPLYLGRAKRLASLGQRLASFAADGGEMCSAPGCTQPATRVEIHHTIEWADGGLTDIDLLAPACTAHHPMIGPNPGQYSTTVITEGPDTGRVAWTLNPQPGMPPNPARINRYPDVGRELADRLGLVRNEIHHSPPPTPDESGLESRMALAVIRSAPCHTRRCYFTWPRRRITLDDNTDDDGADPQAG